MTTNARRRSTEANRDSRLDNAPRKVGLRLGGLIALCVALSVLTGCPDDGPEEEDPDAGFVDARVPDAAPIADSGSTSDAEPELDAGAPDAETPDAEAPDAEPPVDAGVLEARRVLMTTSGGGLARSTRYRATISAGVSPAGATAGPNHRVILGGP